MKLAKPTKGTKSNGARKGPASAPQVPTTAFNFVDAAYSQRHTARLRALVAAGVFLVLWAALAVVGFSSGTGVGDLEQQAAEASATKDQVSAQLSESLGGVSNLSGHLKVRRTEIDKALAHDMDVQQLVADLLVQVPAGVNVLSIEVTSPGAPAGDDDTAATTTTTAAAESGEPKAPAAAGAASLTVQASASSTQPGRPWQEATKQLDYVKDVVVDFSSAPDGTITFTLKASVDLDRLQLRHAAAASELGFEETGS